MKKMKAMSESKIFEVCKEYLLIIIGSIITAASINIFLVPYKIAPGGVSGIATVIYYLTNGSISVGIIMLVLNVPLFIMGIKYIGKKFIVRTLFSTVFLSVAIDVTEPLANSFIEKFLLGYDQMASYSDVLLYSIFGGFLMGLGLGMVLRSGATTGGTDLAAKIVHNFIPGFTVGQILLFIDTSVIIFAAISFGSFQLALYAIVTLYISSQVIDAILEGVNFAKAVFIISDKSDEISQKLMTTLDRGVTALKGTGMYTGNDREVLLCVVHRGQLKQLKEIVNDIDKKAFVILTDVREVLGEGFKNYTET
ncbi:MAG TPA: YitT family protein [Clostridiaceae bacterium]|nr:YitT family protein [Clostridiaceae bacterium]